MSDFQPVGTTIGVQPITEVSTTQKHPFGTRVRARDIATTNYGEGEFIYVKGVTNGAVGSVVLINPDDYTTALAKADDKGKLGVLMAALSASTSYGWAQIYGKGAAKVGAGFADNGDCYLMAAGSAGTVDDTDVAGDFIRGMKGASAIDTPSTGLAEVELGYPEVQDGADN